VSVQFLFKSAVVASVVAITSVAAPAQAASISGFPTPPWTGTGSITPSLSVSPASVELSTGGTATDAASGALQNFLGIAPDALDDLPNFLDALEGSALQLSVNTGDQLTFDFSSLLVDADDYAFTVLNGAVTRLSGSGTLSQIFGSSGLFSIGIVDLGDTAGDSSLSLSNATFTPTATAVPTPALLPGLVGLGLAAMRKRKQQSA
jgi:hypothetical protein